MSTKKPRILVVDDEPDAVELVAFNLKGAGYDVSAAVDGEEALKKARDLLPDLIVLDLMIPAVDGLEVCKILRRDARTATIPIVMLTAKAAEVDRVLGLELGADDYVTKPFSPRELVLRVKRLLRSTVAEHEKADHFAWKELAIDIPRHEVRDVWEYDSLIDTRTVDTHMRRLREKLGPAAKYLGTVRGVGYRFADE